MATKAQKALCQCTVAVELPGGVPGLFWSLGPEPAMLVLAAARAVAVNVAVCRAF